MKKISFSIVAIFILVLTACSKKDKTSGKAEMLKSGSWTLTASMSDEDGDGTYETDDFIDFPVCYTDNYYTFRNYGVLEYNEGLTKCDPGDPQSDEFTWELTNNETVLVIDTDSFAIEELSISTLRIKQTFLGNLSSTATFTKR